MINTQIVMKNLITFFLFLSVIFASHAQCPFNNTPAFGTSGNTNVSNYNVGSRNLLYNAVWAGEYVEVQNVPAGAQMRFDVCDASIDTYLTVFPSSSSTAIAFNDNFCGTGGTRSQIEHTFVTGGNYRIQLNEKIGGNNCSTAGGTNVPLYATLLSVPVVSANVNSIVKANASPTNASSVNYTVTFSSAITGLSASNFSLTTTGVTGASVGTVSGSGTTWTVSVNTGSGDGTIRLDLVNDSGLSPTLANEPFNSGDTYDVDKSPPTISISSIINSPTNVSPIPLTITASEHITGLAFTDFTVSNGSISNFSGSGQNYTANLIPTNSGTVNATIGTNTFSDGANNTNVAPSSFVIQYDIVPPSVSGIIRNNPVSQITNSNTVTFRVAFTESVSGVDLTDFTLATTGNVQGNLSGFSSLGSLFYNVTVNNISGAGTLSINLKNSGTSIVDNSGNAIISGFSSGQTYIINNEPNFSLTSPQNQTICQNSGVYQLDNLLTVSDIDVGQTLTWSIVTGPTNGVMNGFNSTSPSTGGAVTPIGLGYTPNATFIGIETFTIRVSDGVSSKDMVFNITVTALPGINIGTSQTLCEGQTIALTSSGGGDYLWTGPDGFTSTLQNPTITGTTSNKSGTYSLTITANGCSASATTVVTVNNLPTITINSNQNICEGNPINLTSSGGGSYDWTGPNGFTSTSQNPTLNSANVINTGVYSLSITTNGCTASATTSLTVHAIPALGAGADQTLCEGEVINLTATGSGDFSWAGPNGFISLLQNPTINVASLNQSGIYTVTLSLNGCTSSATTSVSVNSLPIVTINSSLTVCEGSSLNLTSSGGGIYSWKGPFGFTSASQNPIITSSILDNQGTYTLTVTANGCNNTATTGVTITPLPSIGINSNLTVCEGSPINLSGTGGGSYAWSGPNSYSSAIQNPVISSALLSNSGIYTLTVTSGVCVLTATASVTVNPLPTITINSSLTLCTGSQINLTASGGGNYTWSGPNGFSSILQNPTILNSTLSNSGIYTVSVTNMGCTSVATANVTINSIPVAPPTGIQYVCAGGNLVLTTTCSGGSVPIWFSDVAGQNSISANLTNVPASTTFYVACELNSCRSSIVPHQVSTDNTIPYTYNLNYIEYVFGCDNGDVKIPLYLSNTAGISFQWQLNTGSGFSDISASSTYNDVTNDTLQISGLSLSMTNYLYRAIISNSCNSIVSDTFRLAINVLPSIVSNPLGQSVCVGNKIIFGVQSNGTGVSYRWQINKGNGFEYLVANSNYENVNSSQLLIKNIPFSFNNYEYRCEVFNTCLSIFSNAGMLQVDPTITILGQPVNKTICQNNSTTFNVSAVHIGGGSVTYQWQISFNGLNYSNLSNNTVYQGVTTSTLSLSNVQMSLNNAKFRCLINNYCQSIDARLNVMPVVTITSNPSNETICEGNFANFTVGAVGQGLTYRWQVNTGAGFVNIYDGTYYQGATAATLQLFGATTSMNGYQYRCVVSGTSTCDAVSRESSPAILNISVSPEAQNIVAVSQINSGTTIYQATEYVLGLNKILSPARAEYRAGNAILLNPGFEVSAGAIFTAKIQNPCRLLTSSNFNLPKTITK
jgi:hypothetical protein